MRFKIDWANLIVGSEFTVFALFFFVFEGNFPSTNPRGAYIWRGDFGGVYTNLVPRSHSVLHFLFFLLFHFFFPLAVGDLGTRLGLHLEGLIFGILRYCPSQEPLLLKCILFSLYIIHVHIFKTLMKKSCFHSAYFRLLHERLLIEPDVSKDARGCARSS